MLKRQLKIVAAIAAMSLAATGAQALTETVNGVEYRYVVWNNTAVLESESKLIGYDYVDGEQEPIYDDVPAISRATTGSISIPESLGGYPTAIGWFAFNKCTNLTSVTIPDSVTSIGYSAFVNCSGLTSVTIPNSITNIGDCAFYECSGLTSLTIPNSVTSIEYGAFYNCSGLTSVTIPDSVTSIGNDAFSGCSATLFDTQTISGLKLVDGWVVGYDSSLFGNLDLTGVRGISSYAFYRCSGLTSVTIPHSVTSIGAGAFSGCSGLTSLTIPNSVTSIGSYAFSYCSGLTSVTIPDTVTSIGNNAFSYCSGLTSVTIPDTVTSIGNNAFYGCSGLTSMTIPHSVTNIGGSAFYNCSGIRDVTVPGRFQMSTLFPSSYTSITNAAIANSVTNIGGSAFSGCSGLTSVMIPDSVTSIGARAFSGCSGLMSVAIPDSVTNIGERAFYNCRGLTSVTIPDSVTSIGGYAFYSCSGLMSAIIGDSVTSIGNNAFYGCPATLFDTQTIIGLKLVDGWVVGCDSSVSGNLDLTGVRGIGDSAFFNCSGLTSVTIPDSVASIGASAFSGCLGLTSFAVGINNPNYSSADGLLLSKNGKILIAGVNGDVVIPDSVTSIEDSAFYGRSSLTSVTIPDSVTSIGDSAFSNCKGLMSVTIPDSVTSIGEKAFILCRGLTSVTIGNGVKSIGGGAFSDCSGLKAVCISDLTAWCGISFIREESNPVFFAKRLLLNGIEIKCLEIPEGTTSIKDYAFSGCIGLTSVAIPDSVTNIGERAFYNCRGLTSVTIPASVTSFEGDAFSGCNGLTSVHLSNLAAWCGISFENYSANPLCYAKHLFINGDEVFDLVIPDIVTSIKSCVFYNCSDLTSVTIPDSVTSIGGYAFYSCSGLMSAIIGDSVTSIGNNAFYGCSGLTSVMIPDSVTSIGASAFYGCSGLTSVAIGSGVKSIGYGAFSNCSGLKAVCISDLTAWCDISFTSVASNPVYFAKHLFLNGIEIKDLGIPEGVTSIGWGAFVGCSGLTSVTIPDSVTSIEGYAFSNCSGLTSVMIPDSVTSIGDSAFYDCSGLTSVTIPDSVKSIGEWAFEGCSGLTSVTIPGDYDFSSVFPSSDKFLVERAVIADGSTDICRSALSEMPNLVSVTIAATVVDIGEYAFSGDRSLTAIIVPDSVKRIGKLAFSGCSGLSTATIGSGVTNIEDNAFAGCSGLKIISIPSFLEGQSTNWGLPNGCEIVCRIESPYIGLYPAALDDMLTWTSGGSWWAIEEADNASGGSCVRSGPIGDSQYSWIETAVEGAGTVSLRWKVSSQARLDRLTFSVDGENKAFIAGEVGWTDYSFKVGGDGLHTLRWTYAKSASGTAGEDCGWLDNVQWTLEESQPVVGYGEALDAPGLVWSCGGIGAEAWIGVKSPSFDGEDACAAYADGESGIARIATEVKGLGNVSFRWRFKSGSAVSGIAFMVDGEDVAYCANDSWALCEYAVTGGGTHSLAWEFFWDGTPDGDAGFLDCVSWTSASPLLQLATNAAPEAVTNAIASAGFAPSVTATLQDAISGDAAKYNEFRGWAQAVKGGDGEAAGEAAVVASTNAAVSWLLGAEKLFVNEPTITIAEMSVAGNDGPVGNGDVAPPDGAALTIAVTVTDGGNPVAVASEKVRGMFESTSDLGDWEGDAKLTPGVEEITGGSGSTLRFHVTPDSTGNSDRAFLRVKVK